MNEKFSIIQKQTQNFLSNEEHKNTFFSKKKVKEERETREENFFWFLCVWKIQGLLRREEEQKKIFSIKKRSFFLQVPSFLHRLDSDAISLVIVVINDSYYIEYVSTTE